MEDFDDPIFAYDETLSELVKGRQGMPCKVEFDLNTFISPWESHWAEEERELPADADLNGAKEKWTEEQFIASL